MHLWQYWYSVKTSRSRDWAEGKWKSFKMEGDLSWQVALAITYLYENQDNFSTSLMKWRDHWEGINPPYKSIFQDLCQQISNLTMSIAMLHTFWTGLSHDFRRSTSTSLVIFTNNIPTLSFHTLMLYQGDVSNPQRQSSSSTLLARYII